MDDSRMRKEDKDIHPQMQRLYAAAKALHEIEGVGRKAELGRRLHVSDQVINGWESRGISAKGAIEAAQNLGIDVNWLRSGEGDMVGSVPPPVGPLQDVVDLVSYYARLHPDDRQMVLRLARSLLPKG